jgi:hypothetical protein
MEMQHMNCCATVLLRYYGNATGCIGHVTKENPICHNIINNFCQWEKEAHKIMRRLKTANIIKDLIWMGQVNVKSGTARDEFVKEQAKVIGQGVLPGLSRQGRNID